MKTKIKTSDLKPGDRIRINAPYQSHRIGTVRKVEITDTDAVVTFDDPLNADLYHLPEEQRAHTDYAHIDQLWIAEKPTSTP